MRTQPSSNLNGFFRDRLRDLGIPEVGGYLCLACGNQVTVLRTQMRDSSRRGPPLRPRPPYDPLFDGLDRDKCRYDYQVAR